MYTHEHRTAVLLLIDAERLFSRSTKHSVRDQVRLGSEIIEIRNAEISFQKSKVSLLTSSADKPKLFGTTDRYLNLVG